MSEKSTAPYVLSESAIEHLKTEISSMRPGEEERFYKPFAKQTLDYMFQKYGSYIPKDKVKSAKGGENRMLFVDSYAFKTLYEDWTTQEDNLREQLEPNIRAFHNRIGHITVFEDPETLWPQVPQEIKEATVSVTGDEKLAKQIVCSAFIGGTIAHETIHQLHKDALPEAFMELGVRYYTKEVMNNSDLKTIDKLINPHDEIAKMGYEYLLNSFGDDVHRWFFGQSVSDEKKYEMWTTAELVSQYYNFPFRRYLVEDKVPVPPETKVKTI